MENKKIVQNKAKLLLLKKIKLKKYPELSKNLKEYFWNIDNYFKPKFKNNYIVINKEVKNAKAPLSANKRKQPRQKTRKFVNNSSNSSDKKRLNDSNISYYDNRKRGVPKNIKETRLKIGQKYITDFEIEDLFSAFKTAQKENKKRDSNFVTANNYIDRNSVVIQSKSTTNFNRFLYEKKKSLFNNNDHKKFPDIIGGEGISHNFTKKNNNLNTLNNFNNNVNNEYYRTTSTFISVNNNNTKETLVDNTIESPSKNINKFCSIEKMNSLYNTINTDINFDRKAKTTNNFYVEGKNILLRNKLIKKQNQYLLDSKDDNSISLHKAEIDNLAKLLAVQEKTIALTSKNKLKIKNLNNLLSKKAHKSKKNLLMTNINTYRIRNELKDKFTDLNSKLEPEHNYNWIKDLRKKSKSIKTCNNANNYNIRDPYNKTIYNAARDINLGKKKYIKYYKNIIDVTNKINKNFEGLYIKGKNLLKMEYDQVKSFKNKKIINIYEMFLPSADVEDILFTEKKNKKFQ